MFSIFKSSAPGAMAIKTYHLIMEQARQPHFYAHLGVQDDVTGRFDLLSLHMALVLRQLKNAPENNRKYSQELFDLFFKDMDRALRELGTGDTVVPKRIQKMGELFFGLLEKVDNALEDENAQELENVLAKNIYARSDDGEEKTIKVAMLVQYVQDAANALGVVDSAAIKSAQFAFPDIEKYQANAEHG